MNGFVSIGGFQKIGGGHPFEEQKTAQAAASLPAAAAMEGVREKQGVSIKYAAGKTAGGCTVLPAGYAEREAEEEAAELPVKAGAGFTDLPAGDLIGEPVTEPAALPAGMTGKGLETDASVLPADSAAEAPIQESFCSGSSAGPESSCEGEEQEDAGCNEDGCGTDGRQEDPAAGQESPDSGDGLPAETAEEEKQAGHESGEKKQEEDQEAAQRAKEKARQEQIRRLESISDDEAMMESIKKVSDDTEKVTRRNMKDCVCEHIQTKCLEDAGFARLTLHPGKSMIKCFQYINRKAWEYAQDELKANGTQPGADRMQVYTSDIPDDLCYQWAEDYFNDPDAGEDKEKPAAKPSARTASAKPQIKKQGGKKAEKSEDKKAAEKKTAGKKTDEDRPVQGTESYGQLSLFSQFSAGDPEGQKGA